jgi:hypothetical protein
MMREQAPCIRANAEPRIQRRWNTDIGQIEFARALFGLWLAQSRFGQGQGQGGRRVDGRVKNSAAGCIDAGRHIQRECGAITVIGPMDEVRDFALWRPAQAVAYEAIHDEIKRGIQVRVIGDASGATDIHTLQYVELMAGDGVQRCGRRFPSSG